MTKQGKKRIAAIILVFTLVMSTLFVEGPDTAAAEIYDTSSMDGMDAGYADKEQTETVLENDGSTDGSDTDRMDVDNANTGSADGGDVSGNHLLVQTDSFVVTDSEGTVLGRYDSWEDLVADFKINGSLSEDYVISVSENAVIGRSMPSQAAALTLRPADNGESVLYFMTGTLNMTTPLRVEAEALYVVDTDKAVNINTKGKELTLVDVQGIGMVKGTSKGSLVTEGNVVLQGNLQSFRSLTVKGTFGVEGNVSGITNLILDKGTVYLKEGKKFTVTNVNVAEDGVLGFPATGALPVVKLNGKVSGVLALKQFLQVDGQYKERKFAAGSKLLTASKASAEQFHLAGEKQVCYKKGSVFYVGAEVLALYRGQEHLGTYAQWNDLKTKVNNLKDKTAHYRVVLLEDYVVNGALSMPIKGRYARFTLQNGSEAPVTLKATGNLSLTADLVLEQGVLLETKQISGAAWKLTVGEKGFVKTTGNFTVKNLYLDRNAGVQAGGKLTVKEILEAVGGNELILTHKKAAAVKNTVNEDKITVKLTDNSGRRVTAAVNTTIMTVTGNSYATQYCLLDERDSELVLYRKGNTLRVKGTVATPVSLSYMDGETEVSLGDYATLVDVKNEIARRKIKQGVYQVHVGEEVLVKGALPLPKSGTYQSIEFTGEKVRITGAVTLTGNLSVSNEIERVKGAQDVSPLPLVVKLGKYTLSVSQKGMHKLTTVTGSTGSGLTIGAGVQQTVEGNLKVDTLTLAGELQVKGNLNVTDIYPRKGNRLDYDLAKNVLIKEMVYGAEDKLLLNPLRNGKAVIYVEDMKVLPNASKVAVSGLELTQETDWVLYRESGAVRLGKSLLTVFENTSDHAAVQSAEQVGNRQFARVTDAVEYINASEGTDYVIRLDADIPSADSLKSPDKGKNVVICGAAGARKTMQLSGNIVVNEGRLEIRDIVLDNGKANGPGVTLINGGQIHLCDVNVNTITASAQTEIVLEGEVDINGSVSKGGDMTVVQNAVIRADNNITVNSLTLQGEPEGTAQLRIQVTRKMTVNNTVSTPTEGQFIINRVDKKDELAELSRGTVMLTAPYAQSTQFKTNNLVPGTFLEWALIKKGNEIQTSEASQGDGEWSGDFL